MSKTEHGEITTKNERNARRKRINSGSEQDPDPNVPMDKISRKGEPLTLIYRYIYIYILCLHQDQDEEVVPEDDGTLET